MDDRENTVPQHRRWIAAAVLGILAVYLAAAWHHETLNEDAFISFQYAKQVAAGNGFRYNAQDPAPLEGYSNFLWVLAAVPFELLGVFPGRWLNVASIATGALTVLLVGYTAHRYLRLEVVPALGGMFALALFPPFVYWSSGGLETMPQTLCFTAATVLLAFDDRREGLVLAGLAALGLVLLRAEGVLWVPVLALLATAVRRLEGRPVRPALAVVGVVLGCWSIYLAWKLWYFGAAFAHTASAKLGGARPASLVARGGRYLAASVVVLLTPALLPVSAISLLRSPVPFRVLHVLAMACAAPAWSVVVGGDYMTWFRFLVPSAPFLALSFALLFQVAWERLRPGLALPVVTTAAAVVALAGHAPAEDRILAPRRVLEPLSYVAGEKSFRGGNFALLWHKAPGTSWVRHFREPKHHLEDTLGVWTAIDAFTDPGEKVVMGGIGKTGYYNDLVVIDPCFLVTPIPPRLLDTLEAGTGPRAGHDNCVGPLQFASRDPDVVIWYAFWAGESEAPGKVRGNLAALDDMEKADRYYADFEIVASKAYSHFVVVGLRLADGPADRARRVEEVKAKLAALKRGKLRPWADLMGRPLRSAETRG